MNDQALANHLLYAVFISELGDRTRLSTIICKVQWCSCGMGLDWLHLQIVVPECAFSV